MNNRYISHINQYHFECVIVSNIYKQIINKRHGETKTQINFCVMLPMSTRVKRDKYTTFILVKTNFDHD